jgi:preprotein translocase subunit SecE
MGRILKKKDPTKKKVLRTTRSETDGSEPVDGDAPVAAKTAPVLKKTPVIAKPKPVVQEPNILNKSIQFLREVKIELKKVTWPSRKQTMGSTIVVLILVLIISLFLGMVDFSLSSLIRMVLP